MSKYIKNVEILKEWDSWIIYDCKKVSWIYRKAWNVSWLHKEEEKTKHEFLMQGKIKLTIEWEEQIVEAPIELVFPVWVEHKIEAITDFIILKYLKN